MICEKCGRDMKPCDMVLSIDGLRIKDFFIYPAIRFYENDNLIFKFKERETKGYHCPNCSQFIAVFDIPEHTFLKEDWEEDLEIDLRYQKLCPHCSMIIDIKDSTCPYCNYCFDDI